MRWGVRDEATDDHMTTELCMREIENCQRLSMGPNFVVNSRKKLLQLKFLNNLNEKNNKKLPRIKIWNLNKKIKKLQLKLN